MAPKARGPLRPRPEDAQRHAGGLDELAATLVTLVGSLGQHPGEHLVHLGRQLGTQDRRHRGRLLDVSPDDRGVQVLLERDPAGEAFVQDTAQRVLVG